MCNQNLPVALRCYITQKSGQLKKNEDFFGVGKGANKENEGRRGLNGKDVLEIYNIYKKGVTNRGDSFTYIAAGIHLCQIAAPCLQISDYD